jgi:hypothetical protein
LISSLGKNAGSADKNCRGIVDQKNGFHFDLCMRCAIRLHLKPFAANLTNKKNKSLDTGQEFKPKSCTKRYRGGDSDRTKRNFSPALKNFELQKPAEK